ncbi:glycosyl hydrolases family 18 domain-containing protein [Trichoderma evansii]
MAVGEIPVNSLTHLNVAFGYISNDFRITNMDGVSSDLYRNVGNLKARNPNLKIVISLGGWAFSDPGPWRSVFPTMTSSSANRAIFIRNLLGFLSEYGYDGVDFDWEYPGADDRGGSDVDAANYVALLKELRAAITSSGHNYTVTFTAPTSYWHLRHFDIKNMASYVDWINLMSYDLHGIWDSANPIGSHVLAHTNLTEIDLALDLFWRAEIEPSSIVLGLAFYGRTFNLKSSSCWKPGCPFGGPGDAGPCTNTAGILSYREIQAILDQTGAASYLDKEAAVRYLVYGNNSWISFDDNITFQAKIDYASKMGLSGLMVWAVDLDDSKLDALRAVSGSSVATGADGAFSLVDLKYLFPSEDLPSSGSQPSYGLVTFGSGGDLHDVSPTSGPFGFVLIAGDSHVVTNLKKRNGEPEPFTFLDCPADVGNRPKHKVQTARVACLSDDLEGCFQILERGVEGTIVEMPDSCAPNSFARGISLNISHDQSVPLGIGNRTPTSPVYDFSFDFNLGLMRRDSDNTRIRLDYSNVPGY